MKLLVVLSLVAYGYADKLDRTYLPPVSAATAGGSPGALTAPIQTGPSFQQGPSNLGSQQGGFSFPRTGSSGQGPLGIQSGTNGFLSPNVGVPSGNGIGAIGGSPLSTASIQSGPSFSQGHSTSESQQGSSGFPQPGSTLGQGPLGVQSSGNGLLSQNNGASIGGGLEIPKFSAAPSLSYGPSDARPSAQSGFAPSGPGLSQFSSSKASGAFNQGFVPSGQNVAQAYSPERSQAAAERSAEILKYVNENNIDSYSYSYETSNGISAQETGEALNGVRAQGAYSYTDDEGQSYSVTYTADENGYQPQGEHLPTPHPIPEEILRSIEENARAAAAGTQEGAYRPEEYESETSQQQYSNRISGMNQPNGQNLAPAQGLQANQGQAISRPQYNQYSSQNQFAQGLEPSNQGNLGLSGSINRNTPFGFDNNQVTQGQRQDADGYKYNQPQNIPERNRVGQNSLSQNGQKQTSFPGSNTPGSLSYNYQGTPGTSSGNALVLGNSNNNQGDLDQFNVQLANPAAGRETASNQGQTFQSPLGTNQIAQGTPSRNGNQQLGTIASSGQGYQYQPNANKNAFAPSSGSQDTDKQIGLIPGSTIQSPQSKKPFGSNIPSGQSTLFTGNSNTQINNENGNRPVFGTSAQGPNNAVSSTNGFRGSQTIQAPYQYNRPDQGLGNQQQSSVGSNGSNGYNGSNGFNGSNGSNGSNGFNGSNGSKGSSGFNGSNGSSSSNGANGFNRLNGSNGPSGSQGAQQFGGPRQPPSFSAQEGYKY